jgi:hypothetical protein
MNSFAQSSGLGDSRPLYLHLLALYHTCVRDENGSQQDGSKL